MSINPVAGTSGSGASASAHNSKPEAMVEYWKGKLADAVQTSTGPHWIGVELLNAGVRASEDLEGAVKFSCQVVKLQVSGPVSTPGDNKDESLVTLQKIEKMVKQVGLGVDFVGEGPAGGHMQPQQALDVCGGIRDLNK